MKNNTVKLEKQALQAESIVHYFDWFDEIDAPQINNRKELNKLWSAKSRCCDDESKRNNRQFYKACYVGMLNNPADKDLEAHCLWLMDVALEKREQFISHNELFLDKYFYFDKPLDNCANCKPANTSARVAQQVARMYQQDGQLYKAIQLLERMNDERSDETSHWVLAENTTQLAELYELAEYNKDNIDRIKTNYLKLKPHRNSKTLGKTHKRFDELEKAYFKLQDKIEHKRD